MVSKYKYLPVWLKALILKASPSFHFTSPIPFLRKNYIIIVTKSTRRCLSVLPNMVLKNCDFFKINYLLYYELIYRWRTKTILQIFNTYFMYNLEKIIAVLNLERGKHIAIIFWSNMHSNCTESELSSYIIFYTYAYISPILNNNTVYQQYVV